MKKRALLALLLPLSLAVACGEPTSSQSEKMAAEKMKHSEMSTLPIEKRLAFMSGHVEAGLALYRAGEPEMASQHLLHPVSETHAAERAGLAELGFDAALFERVSEALEEGKAAKEIETDLIAAEMNLSEVVIKAGGEPKEIIAYLLDAIDEEYEAAVKDGKVVNAGEYQDAWGFTIVAIQWAALMDSEELMIGLYDLKSTWPEAPLPPLAPTSFADIKKQTAKIRSLLN